MSLLDNLKQQAAQNLNRNTGDAAANSENAIYSVTFDQLPVTLEQMKAMPAASLKEPENTAALTIAALTLYPVDREAALSMLEFLHGPKGLSTYDKQFLADRFRDKDYVPRSYFNGATPENKYEPTTPYTLTFFENPYSRSNFSEGYLTLHIKSGGADSARQLKLRTKPSTGQWFLWEQFLLSDIRHPVAEDPWA